MNRRLMTLLVLPALLISQLASGEQKLWKPALPKNRKGDRRLASVNYDNRNEYRSTRAAGQKKDGLEFKLGVLAGAGMQSDSSSTGGASSVGTAPSVGITAEIKNWRYFGIEQDAYFQLSGSSPDIGGSKDSAQGLGSFTTVKGQYPFSLGDVKISPKAGLGFAYQRRTGTSASLASTVESSMAAMGVFGMVGVDIEPLRKFTFSADYAKSVTSDVSIKSGSAEQATENSQFDRIRVGGYYQFLPGMHGGLQYIQRGVSYSQPTLTPGAAADSTNSLRQIQAVFQYEL